MIRSIAGLGVLLLATGAKAALVTLSGVGAPPIAIWGDERPAEVGEQAQVPLSYTQGTTRFSGLVAWESSQMPNGEHAIAVRLSNVSLLANASPSNAIFVFVTVIQDFRTPNAGNLASSRFDAAGLAEFSQTGQTASLLINAQLEQTDIAGASVDRTAGNPPLAMTMPFDTVQTSNIQVDDLVRVRARYTFIMRPNNSPFTLSVVSSEIAAVIVPAPSVALVLPALGFLASRRRRV